ncbi:50S ribosomal protein L13 [Balamuthia mandrillaris]
MASPFSTMLRQPLSRNPMWHVIDAEGFRVGRLAEQIARLLQGKHKPIYSPTVDNGDYVVVKNVEKLKFTGEKWEQKLYRWHTGYPGGLKEVSAKHMLRKHPDKILIKAVSGMLPKNKTRYARLERLRIYVGDEHPHEEQATIGKEPMLVKKEDKTPKIKKRLKGVDYLSDEERARRDAEMSKDPEGTLRKYGGNRVVFKTGKDGFLVIEEQEFTGFAPTVPYPNNSHTRKMQEYRRLTRIISEIEKKDRADKQKRESLW